VLHSSSPQSHVLALQLMLIQMPHGFDQQHGPNHYWS